MKVSELLERIDNIQTNEDLFEILENNPPEEWLKNHDEIPNCRFLPIDKVEFLLRKIFKFNFRYEVIKVSEIFNATSVIMRVHFREFNEPKQWLYFDGVGAEEPEKKIIDNEKTDHLKEHAVSAAIPSAKSNAIKNACYGFGKLFGSDLNRPGAISKGTTSDEQKLIEINTLYEKLKKKIEHEDRLHIERIIEDKEVIDYDKVIEELRKLNAKKK